MANLDFFYPFTSVDGDRKTTAATERRFFAALFTDGVAGADAFPATETGEGIYSIGQGVAIIGGAIGGITSDKEVTAKPADGESMYIALRLDTNNSVRNMQVIATETLASDSIEQLESGGRRDIAIYRVTGDGGGAYTLLDERTYSTTFDNDEYRAEFEAALSAIEDEGTRALEQLESELESIIDSANADLQGMYGAAARQGFNNPCFIVNQREQDAYSLRSGTLFTRDRWMYRITGSSVAEHIIDTVQDGKRHALRIQSKALSGTGSAVAGISQAIEGGVRTFCADSGKFTVSFDAKADAARRLSVEAVQYTTDGSTATALAAQTVNVTPVWQRFSLTFTGTETPTASQLYDVLKIAFYTVWRGYDARFGMDSNDDCTIWLANMQVNTGESAMPCYAKPYADDLADCSRYYARYAGGGVTLSAGSMRTASRQAVTSPMPITERMYRNPTAAVTDRAGLQGCASVEDSAGTWHNGLTAAQVSEYSNSPAWSVDLGADVSGAVRVCFGSVELSAEIDY